MDRKDVIDSHVELIAVNNKRLLTCNGSRRRITKGMGMPVMAIKKSDFLAGYSLFYESAIYGGVFLADIENNRNFTLSPVVSM